MIFNIISYTRWLLVCLLWRNVYSSALHIWRIELLIYVFCYWVVGVICIVWKLVPYKVHGLQIFSLILLSCLLFCLLFPELSRCFSVWSSLLSIFYSIFCAFGVILKKALLRLLLRTFPLFFFFEGGVLQF
jgi:hypothetical protein